MVQRVYWTILLCCLRLPEAKTWRGELQTLAWEIMWAQLSKDHFILFFKVGVLLEIADRDDFKFLAT